MNYMKLAIENAKKATTHPNPQVGAVIVMDNNIISTGYHKYYGGDHAEVDAINNANGNTIGATMYVSLEPCNHYGKTPPCTKAIIESGIKKVFIGIKDTTNKVNGSGIDTLIKNGVECEVLNDENAVILNYEFLSKEIKRPKTTIKVATSLDGKIATKTYDSYGLSSSTGLDYVHKLRTEFDAILIGGNTLMKDDPTLTIRRGQTGHLNRVIIDYELNTTLEHNIFKDHKTDPVIIFTNRNAEKEKVYELRSKSKVFPVLDSFDDLNIVMNILSILGINSVLIEGGGTLNDYLIQQNLIDKVIFLFNKSIIGGENAITSFSGMGISKIKDKIQVINTKITELENEIIIEGDINVHRSN